MAAAGDAVSVVLQDATAAFEAAVAAAGRQARPRDEAPATGAVWDEATDEPARPRPRVLPDPPAWPDEAGEPSSPADPWAQVADQPEPSAQAGETAEPDPGPSTPPSPGEQNPT